MEEEFNIQQYIIILIKNWWWIIGISVVTALVAFGLSSLLTPTYEANALVTATRSQYQLQFDARFQNVPIWSNQTLAQSLYRTYPTLAKGEELLQILEKETNWSLAELKSKLQVETTTDPSLIILNVSGKEPEEVAEIANLWAETFVMYVDNLYGQRASLQEFKQQQSEAAKVLEQTEATLTAFRAENGFGYVDENIANSIVINPEKPAFNNRFGLIGQRLQTKTNLLTDYEEELIYLRQMQQEATLLSQQTTNDSSPVVMAGLLSKLVNMGIGDENQQSFQIILENVDPVAGLESLTQALESRITAIEIEVVQLQKDIPVLQSELAAKKIELEQLQREQKVAAETYEIISRKVQEVQLEPDFNEQIIKIAHRAIVPIAPNGPKPLLNALIAGLLGAFVTIFGLFSHKWWQEINTSQILKEDDPTPPVQKIQDYEVNPKPSIH